jgi:hypothetical protein
MRSPYQKTFKKYNVDGHATIIEQIGKFDLKNWAKIVTFEKWLTITLN